MKKYLVLAFGLCVTMAFTSCKSSESAYPEYVRLIHYKSGDLIKEIRTVSIYKIEEFIEDHAK